MSRRWAFEVSSVVPAPPAEVWERVTTFEGVNHELMPIARMTCPPDLRRIDPATVPIGQPWFRSWIFLFGVLPFDYDHLRLVAIEPGRSFHEDSTMLTQRRWVHRRDLEAVDGGTRVRDRIEFEPRVPVVGALLRPVFQAVFRHRHRRLAAHFDSRRASRAREG
jgi:ligand-binding SRPBCC domain-containing protein